MRKIWLWFFGYKLKDNEVEVWEAICGKAKRGFRIWYGKTKGNDLCGPWIPDLTKEEYELLSRIHFVCRRKRWIPALSISRSQLAYIKFDHIKKKVYK